MNQMTSEKYLNFFVTFRKFQHFNLVSKISQRLLKPLPCHKSIGKMLHAICILCSGSFTQVSELWPVSLLFSISVPRRFLCLWLHMWRSFCHYLFLISPSFGPSGRLCFVNVTFLKYLHLYFCSIKTRSPRKAASYLLGQKSQEPQSMWLLNKFISFLYEMQMQIFRL